MELLISWEDKDEKLIYFPEIQRAWDEKIFWGIFGSSEIQHSLELFQYPFQDEAFDEIHIYGALEKCGKQGDWEFFFRQFGEFWRIMKPGAFLVGSSAQWDGELAWGDPANTRVITPTTLGLLSPETKPNIYRSYLNGGFELFALDSTSSDQTFGYVMRKIR
jgi:hypothetical protein